MKQIFAKIVNLANLGNSIYRLTFEAPEIANTVAPGQFINIRISDDSYPLLRRPFSVYNKVGDKLQILFNAVGRGTAIISKRKEGDSLDIIGPLGNSFSLTGDFENTLLVGGGMGVASLPLLYSEIQVNKIPVTIFVGARNKESLILDYLQNVSCATDDGSDGYKGNVVSLVEQYLNKNDIIKPKIFACGPPPMLRAISKLADKYNILCEVSIESAMACGIGICQGCPVERIGTTNKYSLVCKDGPIFESNTINYVLHG
ncbi:MAG: dihydroorotate dehydrogenase electron transfer subunit [Ignavibacteriales bacterium]|nr:dihydroorotate dehydrogenase electron transfer subunit [Ignavibacteriales bacterium]